MGFFKQAVTAHFGNYKTLSGVPYSFRELTVADMNVLMKALETEKGRRYAFQNLLKSCLLSLGSETGEALQSIEFLAEDVADMLIRLRAASLGNSFGFTVDFPGEAPVNVIADIEKDVKTRPYSFAANGETFDTYAEMIGANRIQTAKLCGMEMQWKLPLSAEPADPEGGLSAAAKLRRPTWLNPETNVREGVDFSEAPLSAFDEFAAVWAAVEGKTDSILTVQSPGGKTQQVNIVGLPGFFSAALAR